MTIAAGRRPVVIAGLILIVVFSAEPMNAQAGGNHCRRREARCKELFNQPNRLFEPYLGPRLAYWWACSALQLEIYPPNLYTPAVPEISCRTYVTSQISAFANATVERPLLRNGPL